MERAPMADPTSAERHAIDCVHESVAPVQQPLLVTIEDPAQRKRVEAALAASEVRYRRLFEAAQDGILLLDAGAGQVIDANPFLGDLLGYSHDEMVGKGLWEMGPFKDWEASRAAFRELQHKKHIRYEDLPLETKQGKKISVEFVSNVYSVDGEAIIQCNIRDITDRKRAEEELHALHLDLDRRVQERTAELACANLALQQEIVGRERAEARERRVVVEERTRIAREIHDTLAQGFTGIVIQLEAAEEVLARDPQTALGHLLRARALARESLVEARRSVWALRAQDLETEDLAYAFLHLIHKLDNGSGTQITFALEGIPGSMSQDIEHQLLRIGQEAVTNALKHAKPTQIRVALTCRRDSVALSIEDSGEGFAPDSPAYQRGPGVRGMRERAAGVGGAIDHHQLARRGDSRGSDTAVSSPKRSCSWRRPARSRF